MKLYGMELFKIVGRKFTWIATGLLTFMLVFFAGEIDNWVTQETISLYGEHLGYYEFMQMSQFFVMCVMVWMTVVLSSFYCEDRQSRTDVLIMTSAKGKLTDFSIRVGVTYTLTIGALVFVLMTAYLICYVRYGYSGGDASVGEIFFWLDKAVPAPAESSILSFIGYYLINVLCAVVMLAGLIVWISARSNKTMYSLIAISGIFWGPIMLENGLRTNGISFLLITAQPMYLAVMRYLEEADWRTYGWRIAMALFVAAAGIICGGRRWCLPRKV